MHVVPAFLPSPQAWDLRCSALSIADLPRTPSQQIHILFLLWENKGQFWHYYITSRCVKSQLYILLHSRNEQRGSHKCLLQINSIMYLTSRPLKDKYCKWNRCPVFHLMSICSAQMWVGTGAYVRPWGRLSSSGEQCTTLSSSVALQGTFLPLHNMDSKGKPTPLVGTFQVGGKMGCTGSSILLASSCPSGPILPLINDQTPTFQPGTWKPHFSGSLAARYSYML